MLSTLIIPLNNSLCQNLVAGLLVSCLEMSRGCTSDTSLRSWHADAGGSVAPLLPLQFWSRGCNLVVKSNEQGHTGK